jgi:hypothetical protein
MELDSLTISLFNACLKRTISKWEIEAVENKSLKELENKHYFFSYFMADQIAIVRDSMIVQRDLTKDSDEFNLFNDRSIQLSNLFKSYFWLDPAEFELFLGINDPDNSTDILGNINTAKSNKL